MPIQVKTNSLHMTPGPGIEPGTHWWKASALVHCTSPAPLKQLGVGFNLRTDIYLGELITESKLLDNEYYPLMLKAQWPHG